MEHYFPTESGRTIAIRIEDGNIDFEFKKGEHRQWFYDIPVKEWKSAIEKDERGWIEHMKRKNWFTDQMKSFIDANT